MEKNCDSEKLDSCNLYIFFLTILYQMFDNYLLVIETIIKDFSSHLRYWEQQSSLILKKIKPV